MADTFARVELHERWAGDKPDYDALHKHMEQEGFVRYMFEGLKKVKLPTGMYRSSLNGSILLLKSKAVFAAAKTGHKNEGMIWRGEDMQTWGLEVMLTIPAPLAKTSTLIALASLGRLPSGPTLLTGLSAPPAPPLRGLASSLLSSTPDSNREWERPNLLSGLVPKR